MTSPRIRWYPDVMSPGVRWLVPRSRGSEAAEQRLTWDRTRASKSGPGILTACGPFAG
jgi:hypothetical protein